ncbi:arylamine N-acetyltransferase family protein [Caldimonas tepidiphila]|uniref:arylamine N-acetyltransferase family protein n=1 Tax=Caldimonas tepidiphila TaxID=2315841 RepID=UPI000E5C5180|nr:arylamine N-acetyltransferase [Caldimonas tepidiphila]
MIDLDAYLARIGAAGCRAPTLATLSRLVAAHAAAIPFENLDPLLGRPPLLEPAAVERKLVHEHRGGYCFEHNLLLAEALRALGFEEVASLAARVLWNQPEDALNPRTHMLLRVAVEGRPHLVDVGFGGLTLTGVLALEADTVQPTPHEPFRLLRRDEEWRLQACVAGQWKSLYRFDLMPQHAVDLQMANHFVATHPRSIFVGNLLCARALPGRRLALLNRQFTVHHPGGTSDSRLLPHADAVCEVLQGEFGLRLPDMPALRQRLAALPDPASR